MRHGTRHPAVFAALAALVFTFCAAAGAQEKSRNITLPGGQTLPLVWIAPGEFKMGAETGATYERPVHPVTISKGFYLGATEVTQAQWKAVMGECPARFAGDRNPMNNVSWNDCRRFCETANALPAVKASGLVLRLPTEAEWEYAYRAGSPRDEVYGVIGKIAWYQGNNEGFLHPVGQKQPNAWGLFDMSGGVWEWCSDWFWGDAYRHADPADPAGPEKGTRKVIRGGAWNVPAPAGRPFARNALRPDVRSNATGLRVAAATAD